MTDGNNFNFLQLGKSNRQISLSNFNGEIKRENLTDKNFLKLFDFFDENGNQVLESEEIKNLWNNIVTNATANGNSIFEENEATTFLSQNTDKNGNPVQSLGIDTKKLFQFLYALNNEKNKQADINNPNTWEILPQENDSVDCISAAGYNELENLLNNSSDKFIAYLKEEGAVSHFVNLIRTGKKNPKKDDVELVLNKIKHDLEFLKAAYENRLICGGRAVSFKTAFKILNGVEYSIDNINDCNEKSQKYTYADTVNRTVNSMIYELEEYSSIRSAEGKIDLNNPAKFNTSFLKLFSELLNIKDQGQINTYLTEFCEKYKNNPIMKKFGGEIQLLELGTKDKNYYGQKFALMRKTESGWKPLAPEQMQLLADYTINNKLLPMKTVLLGLDENASNEDCENYVAECKKDYEDAFKKAYGTNELGSLVDDYINAQQTGLQVVNIAFQIGLMVATIFTSGVASVALTGLMIAQPTVLLEKLTDGDGATWNDIEEHGKTMLQSLPWMALGYGAGKLGDMARACCKLKGLQIVANRSGKTLDDIIKAAGKNNLGKDALKVLKTANKISQVAGVSTEVAIDMATTRIFQQDGLTTADWIMSIVGALQGTVMQKKLAGMFSQDEQIKYLQKNFEGTLNLTGEEAKLIIDKMVMSGNLSRVLPDVDIPAPKPDASQKPEMGLSDATKTPSEQTKTSKGEPVKVLPAENNEGFIVKIGDEEYAAKDFDEVKNIIDTKAKDSKQVDFSALKLEKDIMSSDIYQSNYVKDGKMIKNESYELNVDCLPVLKLPDNTVLDLNNLYYAKQIYSLQEGQCLTIGREGDIRINNPYVSREHVVIYKKNGRIKIKDISANGTVIQNLHNKPIEDLQSTQMCSNQSYFLNEKKLPKLKLANEIEINLNDYKFQIDSLQEGQCLTIGREGDIRINDPSMHVSALHVIIYRSNGQLKIKDISTNGTTAQVKNNIFNRIKNIFSKTPLTETLSPQEIKILEQFKNVPEIQSVINKPVKAKKLIKKINEVINNPEYVSPEIKTLFTEGITWSKGVKIENCGITKNIMNDIVKIATTGDYITSFKTTTEAFSKTPVGDVAKINGKLYVNNGSTMEPINMREETFRKLFPPVKRFATHQGAVGTCYLVSTLENLYNSPKGRVEIYRMIGEDNNGIYTTTFNSKGQRTRFERWDRYEKHIRDKSGLAIIEQGYCKNTAKSAKLFDPRETIIMQTNAGGYSWEAINGLLGRMPYVLSDSNFDSKYFADFIKQNANNPNIVINCATKSKNGLSDSNALNTKYDIWARHEYSIKGYNQNTNCVLIANPWHSEAIVEIPLNEFLLCFKEISYISF